MTKLVIDAVGIKSRGGAVVLLDVLRAVEGNRGVEHVWVLASPRSRRSFTLEDSERRTVIDVNWAESQLGRFWWALNGLRRWTERIPNAVVLGLNGYGAGRMIPSAIFLQQPVPYYNEALAMYPWVFRRRMEIIRALQKRAARSARAVIVQSDEFKKQVPRALGVPSEKITVCLPCPPALPPPRDEDVSFFSERLRISNACGVVLYVGSDAPHKNLGVLRAAMGILPNESPLRCWLTLPAKHRDCNGSRLDGVGAVDRQKLAALYATASILIMPSITETVGLPLLEAMAAGIPVLAADRPYAHAICGEAALLFDPKSPVDCAEKIQCLVNDRRLRAHKVQIGNALLERRSMSGDPYAALVRHTIALAETNR